MPLNAYKTTKLLNKAASSSISDLAQEFGITYSETRGILKKHGVKLKRGRKRGSGEGVRFASSNGRFDRRISWIQKQIKLGRCTSCGGDNDSDSMYHCTKCLRRRNEAKKK